MTYTYTANTNLVITLAEIKEHLRLESNYTAEDDLITSYIKAATSHAEKYFNRFFLDTTIAAYYDEFPSDEFNLYKGQVSELTSITYKDTDSATQTWDASKYDSDLHSIPARVKPTITEAFPDSDGSINNITLTYKVGWDSGANVPEDIKNAIKLIIARLYLVREDTVFKMPTAAEYFLNPFRLNYL